MPQIFKTLSMLTALIGALFIAGSYTSTDVAVTAKTRAPNATIGPVVLAAQAPSWDVSVRPGAGAPPARGPAPSATVLLKDGRRGNWSEVAFSEVPPGANILHNGHLYRHGAHGEMEYRGSASLADLASADQTYVDSEAHVMPGRGAWVLVLGDHAGAVHLTL